MLKLPDVTLNIIETRQRELGRMAVQECLDRVEFGDVLIMTDQPAEFAGQGRIIEVPDWPDKVGWSRANWFEISPHVRTSHVLSIQWDSWVVDTSMWTDEFLRYDYIGAPWWHRDGMNVGNGGFCLRSTAFLRYLRSHQDKYPCTHALDDVLYCRDYRPALQDAGFTWAPDELAIRFAIEVQSAFPRTQHFGFHASYNFDYGCGFDREKILQRARIMAQSDYITKGAPYIWNGFVATNKWVTEELGTAVSGTEDSAERERSNMSAVLSALGEKPGLRPLDPNMTLWANRRK